MSEPCNQCACSWLSSKTPIPNRFKPLLSKSLTDNKVSKSGCALLFYTKAHFQREWGTCISSVCHL